MKHRNDFENDAGSHSLVTIHLKNDRIEAFLNSHGLDTLFKTLKTGWKDTIVGIELKKSFSDSLAALLTAYMENPMIELDAAEDAAIDELTDLLRSEAAAIDGSVEGSIELRESCEEDNYGYYQKLSYGSGLIQLTKWPSQDGTRYDESFAGRLFQDTVPELENLDTCFLYQVVRDDAMLAAAVAATGCLLQYVLPKNQEPPVLAAEGTGWIQGRIFVLSGISHEDADEITEVIERSGGEIKNTTVAQTSYVIYDPEYRGATKKMKRARELIRQGKEIVLLSVEQFWQKIGPEENGAEALAAAQDYHALFDGRADREDGVYYIFGSKQKTANLCIPGMIDGLPVAISHHAFSDDRRLQTLVFSEGVVAIETGAFADCKNLTSITFSSTIRKFGSGLFSGSPWKASQGDWLIVNHVLLRYSGAENTIVVPDGVEEIGAYAFDSCKAETVILPDSVRKIDGSAFCRGQLKEIKIPAGVCEFGPRPFCETPFEQEHDGWLIVNGVLCGIGREALCSEAFRSSSVLKFPDGITSIAPNSSINGLFGFENTDHFTEAVLPEGLKEIGDNLFLKFKNLKTVVLPSTLEKIGSRAFEGCAALTELHLPDGLKEVGILAFSGCRSLETVIFPDSVVSLGRSLFAPGETGSCEKLELVAFPKSLPYLPEAVLHSAKHLKKIILPEQLKEIRHTALEGCAQLQSVSLPDGLTTLGVRAFYGCASLSELTLPGTVQSLSHSAFKRCAGLEALTIPDGVTDLPEELCKRCTALKRITLPASVTSIGAEAFDNCPDLTVCGPADSCAAAYAREHGLPFLAE